MTAAFVLGNGVSRKGLDLPRLQTYGKIYGCNALYREFTPDVLISTDKPIREHIQNSGYSQKNRVYTRHPLPGLGALAVPFEYQGFSSGPIAVGLAAIDRANTVYLLGFDMGPAANGKFNNVYADTEFYRKSASVPTFTGNWVRQIIKVAKDFPKIEFVRVKGATTADIPEFNEVPNIKHMQLDKFLQHF